MYVWSLVTGQAVARIPFKSGGLDIFYNPVRNEVIATHRGNNEPGNHLTLDASRALNASGSVRGRVAAGWRDSDSFVDITNTTNGLIYGVVEADLTPDTTLGVGATAGRRCHGVMMARMATVWRIAGSYVGSLGRGKNP